MESSRKIIYTETSSAFGEQFAHPRGQLLHSLATAQIRSRSNTKISHDTSTIPRFDFIKKRLFLELRTRN